MDRLVRFATLMADSKATVPQHLAGKPADCLAVTMQAAQWGMNPFAVAQKTHVVNGTLGYEAQLVNAVVSSSNLLSTRLNYRWDGDWSKVNGKSDKSPSLTVTVSAVLKGEAEPRELTISMAQAGVRNSPLWEQDPRQQLAYPEEILHAFSGAAMNYNTQADLDKAYKYVAQKLAGDDDMLAKATDVYTIRCDELNEVPM
ncbi:hypothetical protein HMG95_24410 [Salmonella enterica subsp. enterica serovar Heidelberg]|nr:hypothetical protein [Salmonella enterica subsp. enterica serovar Heidelberg]